MSLATSYLIPGNLRFTAARILGAMGLPDERASAFTAWERSGTVKGIAVLIGGADGHTEELRRAVQWQWSLSKLTLQHEMALLFVLEQVYRAYTIKAGTPYHRD